MILENKNIRTKDNNSNKIIGVFNENTFINEVIKNKIIIELNIAIRLLFEK